MKTRSELARVNHIYPFLYLFTMDINRIPFQTYEKYENFEPGFSGPFISAYIEAFNEPVNARLSHSLFKKINQTAMSHKQGKYGQYRKIPGHFMISFEKYDKFNNAAYTATIEGLQTFISHWIDQVKSPHMLAIQPKKNPDKDTFALVSEDNKTFWCLASRDSVRKEVFNPEVHNPLIRNLTANFDYEFYVNTMVFAPGIVVDFQEKITQMMQQIFDDFYQEMSGVVSSEEKITLIAKHIQRITQLHPFEDGNIRTCYIIMNKLLLDHGLSLSILFNPNKLDACALPDLVKMIKEGQAIYQQLVNHHMPDNFEIKTDESIAILQNIACPPYDFKQKELLKSFCETIIKREQTRGLSQGTAQRFFSSNGDFSCTLRNSCNRRELLIIKELLNAGQKMDLNQQSSNGNTALDWLDKSTVSVDPGLLIEVRALLVAHGAENHNYSPAPACEGLSPDLRC